MIGHPSDAIFEEVAYLAYHFHWPYDQIMSLDHRERHRWVDEVVKLNQRADADRVERMPW